MPWPARPERRARGTSPKSREVRTQHGPARGARAHVSGRVLRFAVAALLVVALGVFHIWSRTRVLDSGYALGELERQHDRLAREHDRLVVEVETLRSPATLEKYARDRLGMAPPAPGAVWAAGPRLAVSGEEVGRAAAGSGWAAAGSRVHPAATGARDVVVPGEQLASRGPLRAGRVPRRELP